MNENIPFSETLVGLLYVDIRKVGKKPENLKKPDDNNDHNNNVDDPFDFPVHRDVGVDKP
jgi:hypothetical protein